MTHRTVQDVMTVNVRSAYVRSTAKQIAEQLDAAGVSALPVLDDEATVVGLVSEADLLHKITYQDDADDWPRLFHRHRVDRAKAAGVVAADLMTAPAVTVAPDASVVEAAALMEKRHVKRLPVVNDTGKLVGIVSRGDLVRLFVRSDATIAAEVQHELARTVTPDVTVEVSEGIVTLSGNLERSSQTELAYEFARRVDGVVNVVNSLTFTEDDTVVRYPVGPFM